MDDDADADADGDHDDDDADGDHDDDDADGDHDDDDAHGDHDDDDPDDDHPDDDHGSSGADRSGAAAPPADTQRTSRSSARTRARKMALDILFESEMRGLPTGDTLVDRIAAAGGGDPTARPVRAYTVTVVEGVRAQRERVDGLISTYARDWTLERMPGVDRAILRIGVWELLYNRDVPPSAVISEAVGLASSLSTDASPGFVNGLLARIADLVTDV